MSENCRYSFDPACCRVYFETAVYHRTWSWPWGGVVDLQSVGNN
jgi:hypothetical protein